MRAMSPNGKPTGLYPALPAPASAASAASKGEKLKEADRQGWINGMQATLRPAGVRSGSHLQFRLKVGGLGQARYHLPVLKLPAELTINNNARLHHNQSVLPPQRLKATTVPSCRAPRPLSPPRAHQAGRVAAWTFTEYLRSQKEHALAPLLVNSRSNAGNSSRRHNLTRDDAPAQRNLSSDAAGGVQRPMLMFNRPQLSTFAEYQKRTRQVEANRPISKQPGADGSGAQESTDMEFGEMDIKAVATDALEFGNEGEEDAESAETRKKGCCACCSRNRKEQPDSSSRRKRRVVGPQGSDSGETNKIASLSMEDEAELSDMKDMDPTITLMPYVLFESERAKVLYQSSSVEEVELLKRAINLHANDMYKKVLMRLHMYRYLHLFKEAVVRSVLSKKVQLGQNSALAANVLGIDITEDSKSGSRASSSDALTVGATFDSHPVEMLSSPNPAINFAQASEIARAMFTPAPKFNDAEILELLNSGKIIDVTGRASLESLVSLPTTKVGQRRNSKGAD